MNTRRQLQIADIRAEAEGVRSIGLVAPDRGRLPGWEPGAHLDVWLPNGLVRQYSLCGEPGASEYRIAVLRTQDSRGGSAYLHEEIAIGDKLTVVGPKNHFALEPADQYLFIAGGIGITPILPMIAATCATGTAWRLIYGGRSRSTMSFVDRLLAYGADGQVTLVPQDVDGLPNLVRVISTAPASTSVYCCGPEPLLDAVTTYCDRYLRLGALHLERFTSGHSTPANQLGGERAEPVEFEVELARSGHVLTVPADRTVLAVVRGVLPDILSSCEEGFCGTCETTVIAGTPQHHDQVLSEKERASGTTMMICVSRANGGRLVLDL